MTHLVPFVEKSRQKIRKDLIEDLGDDIASISEDKLTEAVEKQLKREIRKGVRILQYQINTLMTTNGQAPFVSVFMYLNEVETEKEKEDLALIIEEVLRQRIIGVKNEAGQWVAPAFPKLLYVLEEDNIKEDSKYWYLTKLAAECTTKRMVPDYISEKIMLQDKYPKEKLLTIKQRKEQWGDESIWGKNIFKNLSEEECKTLQQYVEDKNKTEEVEDIIKKEGLKKRDIFPIAYPCMGATRGDEIVSIKVSGEVFENIPIKQAFGIVKVVTKNDMHSNNWNEQLDVGKKEIGVYKITHTLSGKYYIGSSKDIRRRWREHYYSIRHKGTLGDNYNISDFNTDNYTFDVLEYCDADDLLETESKYVDLNDVLCTNKKDPLNNGNFTTETHTLALNGVKYSTYENKGYTWYRKIDHSDIFIMSNGEWQPIRAITYNDETCPLKLYEVKYQKGEEIKTLHITEDHPLHTQRGRVIAKELTTEDKVIDCVTNEKYNIVSVEETEEKCETYDFEVDNDIFDLSGIISHNCRSFLTPDYIHYKYYGRLAITIEPTLNSANARKSGVKI